MSNSAKEARRLVDLSMVEFLEKTKHQEAVLNLLMQVSMPFTISETMRSTRLSAKQIRSALHALLAAGKIDKVERVKTFKFLWLKLSITKTFWFHRPSLDATLDEIYRSGPLTQGDTQ